MVKFSLFSPPHLTKILVHIFLGENQGCKGQHTQPTYLDEKVDKKHKCSMFEQTNCEDDNVDICKDAHVDLRLNGF